VAETGTLDSKDAVVNDEYEQQFLQFIVSRVPDESRPELLPPQSLDEGETADDIEDMVIDMNAQVLSKWFTKVYNTADNRLRTLRICYALAMVLASMCSRASNRIANPRDTLNKHELDNIDAAIHMNIPINQLAARSFTALMAVIGHYAGDSGASMQTLLRFIRHPADTAIDEEDALAVVEAVKTMGELDFLTFPVFERTKSGQSEHDDIQTILDGISEGE